MNGYKLPPKIGDRIVISNWAQFPTIVNCVETFEDKRVCIYVTTKYPKDDPFFEVKEDRSKVYLHDEGESWCRYEAYQVSQELN